MGCSWINQRGGGEASYQGYNMTDCHVNIHASFYWKWRFLDEQWVWGEWWWSVMQLEWLHEYLVCINQNQLVNTRNADKTTLKQLLIVWNNGYVKEWDVRQQRYCHSNPVNFGIILIAFFSSIFWWKKVKACLPQHEYFSFFFFFFLLLLLFLIIMKSKILSYHTRGFSFSSTGYQMVSSLLW